MGRVCKAGMLALITWPAYKFKNYIWCISLIFSCFHLILVFIIFITSVFSLSCSSVLVLCCYRRPRKEKNLLYFKYKSFLPIPIFIAPRHMKSYFLCLLLSPWKSMKRMHKNSWEISPVSSWNRKRWILRKRVFWK